MTSKIPIRVAEDVDETALSYAEIKALATGNPLIIEKCQLEFEVSKLKILHAGHLAQKYALEDKVYKEYPKDIKRLNERIAGYTADIETLKANVKGGGNGFPTMKIAGVVHTEKKAAGSALLAECNALKSPEPVALGCYRGFSLELSFDLANKEYTLTMRGHMSYSVMLGSDLHGNITRIDNALESMEGRKTNCEQGLENTTAQLEAAKGEINRPFAQAHELNEKELRLKEVDALLRLDEKDHELLDDDTVAPNAEEGREVVGEPDR